MEITNTEFTNAIIEWKKRSECGEVCGMFGCQDKPTVPCSRCGNWYCNDHSKVHFHIVE